MPRVKPPSPGTLPPHGREILDAVYEDAKARLVAEGIAEKSAKRRASQQAWCAVKREYYKRGKKWHRRAERVEQPPGCVPRRNPPVENPNTTSSFSRERIARLVNPF